MKKRIIKIILVGLISILCLVSVAACNFGQNGGDDKNGPFSVTIEYSGDYDIDYCQIELIDYYGSAEGQEAIIIEPGSKIAKDTTVLIVVTTSSYFKVTSLKINNEDKMSEVLGNTYAAILHKVTSDTVIKAEYFFDSEIIDITGVTFENKSFVYDGEFHSFNVSGTIPNGVTVEYTLVGDESGNEFSGATEVGTYEVKATLSGLGFNKLELTATFRIVENDPIMLLFNVIPEHYAVFPPSDELNNESYAWFFTSKASIKEVLKELHLTDFYVNSYYKDNNNSYEQIEVYINTALNPTEIDVKDYRVTYYDGLGSMYYIFYTSEQYARISNNYLHWTWKENAVKYYISAFQMDDTVVKQFELNDDELDLRDYNLEPGVYYLQMTYIDENDNGYSFDDIYFEVKKDYSIDYYNPFKAFASDSFEVYYTSNNSQLGSVSVKNASGTTIKSGGSVSKNEQITITVQPNSSYTVGSILINGIEYKDQLSNNKINYTVSDEVSIKVVFNQPITGVTFEGGDIEYTASDIELKVQGDLPQGVTVLYKTEDIDYYDVYVPKAYYKGTYNVSAKLSGVGYETLILDATFNIVESTDPLLMYFGVEPLVYDIILPSSSTSGNIEWRFSQGHTAEFFVDYIKDLGDFYLSYYVIDTDGFEMLLRVSSNYVTDPLDIQGLSINYYKDGTTYLLDYTRFSGISLDNNGVLSWQNLDGATSYNIYIGAYEWSSEYYNTTTTETEFDFSALSLQAGVYTAYVSSTIGSEYTYAFKGLLEVRGNGEVVFYEPVKTGNQQNNIYFGGGNFKHNGTMQIKDASGSVISSGQNVQRGSTVTITIDTINNSQIANIFINGVDYLAQLNGNTLTYTVTGETNIWVIFNPSPMLMMFSIMPDEFTIHEVGSDFLAEGGYVWTFNSIYLDLIADFILDSNTFYLYSYNRNYMDTDNSLHVVLSGLDATKKNHYVLNHYSSNGYMDYYDYRVVEGLSLNNRVLSWQSVQGALEYSFGVTNYSDVGFEIDIADNEIDMSTLALKAGVYFVYAYPRSGDTKRIFEVQIQVRGDGVIVFYEPIKPYNQQNNIYFGDSDIYNFGHVQVLVGNNVVNVGENLSKGTIITINITPINDASIDKVFINGVDCTSQLNGNTLDYTVQGETNIWVTFNPSP